MGHKSEANLIYTGSSKIAKTTFKKKKKFICNLPVAASFRKSFLSSGGYVVCHQPLQIQLANHNYLPDPQ